MSPLSEKDVQTISLEKQQTVPIHGVIFASMQAYSIDAYASLPYLRIHARSDEHGLDAKGAA